MWGANSETACSRMLDFVAWFEFGGCSYYVVLKNTSKCIMYDYASYASIPFMCHCKVKALCTCQCKFCNQFMHSDSAKSHSESKQPWTTYNKIGYSIVSPFSVREPQKKASDASSTPPMVSATTMRHIRIQRRHYNFPITYLVAQSSIRRLLVPLDHHLLQKTNLDIYTSTL